MKKVFIPIIVLLVLGCFGIGFQWRMTYLELRASQNQAQLLVQEVNALSIELSRVYGVISQQEQQIASLQRDYLQVSEQADEALQLLTEAIETIELQEQKLWTLDRIITMHETQLNQQQQTIETVNAQNANLIQQADTAKFTFYYASLGEQRYGIAGLEECLNRWKWARGTYKADEFDCSEMGAYLEWKLEDEGYHTIIIGGDSPILLGEHIWLLVELEEGHYIPVEPTTHRIIYWNDPHFDGYFIYDYEFETIHDALRVDPTEFDWWK